ncbi:MAG: indolepyruvate ferredoxin oxidoreductase family protein [Betaproteobacteria bacterium]|nr:indolepyruvate ferredoxin oxidoreductase family protein [Betaproteobacteria bacterium]
MNAPVDPKNLSQASLDDKYTQDAGTFFMTGTQALVRLPMLQHQRDKAAGKHTAGYISGYRGSPLGSYDQTLIKTSKMLEQSHIKFQPGVNEDLAATAIWGTQQTGLFPGAKYDGVFSIWYGKGPGVDRCGDVFKHANMSGTNPWGGVLALAGDDHGAKSSTTAHQSEQIFIAVSTPVFYPASVQDVLDYGIHGWAMSRFTGLWVGIKCVTDIIESGATVELDPARVQIVIPQVPMPPEGLNISIAQHQFIAEEDRLLNYKLPAVKAYVRANKLNRIEWREGAGVAPTLGIVSAGKAYRDLRQALADIGIDEAVAAAHGIRLYKLAVTWPLEESGVQEFAQGLPEIFVVEEKRPLIEGQIKDILYGTANAPRIIGKADEQGKAVIPLHGETTPSMIARALAARIALNAQSDDLRERIHSRLAYLDLKEGKMAKSGMIAARPPYFCSGCPHNSSTKVPEGSRALAGIGCHYMVQWMDRSTSTFTHMGGEGMTWVGHAPFTSEAHVFINLGDGTYFHSGLLAIRAAVASKVNATYKILYNDAVAMTGGQRHDGSLNPQTISLQIHAEGVSPIVVVTDEPHKYPAGLVWAPGVTVRHRDELEDVQKDLRAAKGISAIIYDQTCASEKRRRRKRGEFPDPPKRAFINDAVCEGCGDCSVQSNCISVEPLETEFGRKRKINQSSCNKDYSCVKGFCPSFVTVEGGQMKKPKKASAVASANATGFPDFPAPMIPSVAQPYGILVNGIGGTGVITIGQILAVAAHMEGKGASVLDMSGLAQKGGPVMSHVWIAEHADAIHTTRVGIGAANLVVGCDLIVTASKDALQRMDESRTHVVANSTNAPTAAFVKNPNWQFPEGALEKEIQAAAGAENTVFVEANRIAVALMGDAIATNMFMLGFAFQKGWVPVGEAALMKAIELNGVSIDFNKKAFNWGRYAAHDLAAVERIATPAQVISIAPLNATSRNIDELVAKRIEFLTAYQDAAYAKQYSDFVAEVRTAEAAKVGGTKLTEAVARYYYKLMAYKDEYEVARLYTDPAFMAKINNQFEGDFKLKFHLAPPLFAKRNAKGELVKKEYGAWMLAAFKLLAGMKGLRGGALDMFGYTEERKKERALIGQYRDTVRVLLDSLSAANLEQMVAIASLPEEIRGYGHVKERHLQAAKARQAQLVQAMRSPAQAAAKAA